MSDNAATVSTRVITPVGTLSYPWLATAQSPKLDKNGNPQGNPKFSTAIIFAPGTDMSGLEAAANAAADAAYPGKGIAMLKSGALRSPFRRDCEAKNYKNCAVFMNVRTENKPGAVFNYRDSSDPTKAAKIPDDKITDELYPGVQAKLSLNAFAYNQDGNKGVSFGLNNVQKIGEGERLDGRAAAEDEFSGDLSEAPVEDLPF